MQWRALTKALLARDYRARAAAMSRGGKAMSSAKKALIMQALLYGIMGALIGGALARIGDLFFGGFILCTYVMFIVGTAVMLDHATALTSTDDYSIIGYRPVESRTYFAVRLTNVFASTLLLTAMVSWAPVAALVLFRGWQFGVAGVLASFGASIALASALLVSYSSIQRLVGANLLKQVLSVLQLVMSFMIYGGYMVVSRMVSDSLLESYTIDKTWWLALTPPAIFASYFDLGRGDVQAITVVPAALSVVATLAMGWALMTKLSKGFTERLGETSVQPRDAAAAPGKTRRPARSWLFRQGEARAMALLIRSQFRNDQKFRMGVLAIVPLTALYLFQGMSGARPSTGAGRAGGQFMLVGFAIMMFPPMLKMQLSRSDAFRASWVFFASPVSRARIIRAAKNVVITYFLLPYLIAVAAAMAYISRDPVHALAHTAVMGLASHFMLQLTIFMDPEIPFAKPPDKGGGAARMMGLLFLVALVNVALTVVTPMFYSSWIATASISGGIIVLSVILELITKARIEEQARKLEFAG